MKSTEPNAVAQARALLAQVEEAQREERRAQLITQLAATRAELHKQQKALERIRGQVFHGQSDLDNVRSEMGVVAEALSMFEGQRPAVANFLPDDPEVTEWRRKCDTLRNELERLRLKRAALPNIELLRIEGVTLAQRVQALQFSESSILSVLDGSIATTPVGGLFSPM